MKKILFIFSLLCIFSTLPAFAEGTTGEKAEGACSDNGCKCIDDSNRGPKADIAAEDASKDDKPKSTKDK